MKRWTARQLIALVLGVVFALGTTLSTVQAADMAVKMSVDATMGTAATPDACVACGGDDDAASAGSCMMVCPNSVQAVGPAAGSVVLMETGDAQPLGEFPLAGRYSQPDPYPPKPVVLS